jgi:1,4-alpha-glucan branching enzyme
LNSDALEFGGSGVVNNEVVAEAISTHGFDQSLNLTIPPLAAVFLMPKD